MTTTSGTRVALRAILQNTPDIPGDRAWEGEDFTPRDGYGYVRETLDFADSPRVTPGPSGLIMDRWLYLLDLVVPKGTAITLADDMADTILNAYRPGAAILGPGFTGRVDHAKRVKALIEPGWLQIPITITGYTHRSKT